MKIIIRNNAAEGSLWAAHYIAAKINEKAARTDKPFVIGLCTGSTPYIRKTARFACLKLCFAKRFAHLGGGLLML